MGVRGRALRAAALGGAALVGLLGYAQYASRRYEDLDPESAGAPGSFVDVEGVRVHYVEAGQGEAVVLVHGFGASTFSFRYTIPELARYFRVVALDLKGFGYSARPAGGDYSLTAQAELVRGVMDRLGIARATVVGHSMGGAVAMRLALRHPNRVARLVLVDTAVGQHLRALLRLGSVLHPLAPVAALLTLHSRRFREAAVRSAVHDPAHVTPEVVEGYFRPMRIKGNLRALGEFLADGHRDEPLEPERIGQPTLLMWGEQDPWLRLSVGEELARLIPDARLVLVPASGHLPLEEQPDHSNRLLLEFLRPAGEAARSAAQPAAEPETAGPA